MSQLANVTHITLDEGRPPAPACSWPEGSWESNWLCTALPVAAPLSEPAVALDIKQALLMRQISLVAGLETLIIALFLILGVKVASWI